MKTPGETSIKKSVYYFANYCANSANGWMCQASLTALHLNFSIAYVRSVEFQMETYLIICRQGAQNQVISRCRGLLRNAEQSRLKNARIELLFRPLLRQGNTSG